ncbi:MULTISPECIES: aldehyde dehydrogenase family protein [unclassified Chelatococcus]|jgi:aldehyde dehydrogenase (NAD+)|uniref:aldehyde dehydrogenase family protein n=1 Tax=unclassified Chelatococcus TaxID=2638111 RepID=UPI001BCA915C|nr:MULTISPECIES: aldehyde dehydrogenase family protein [unclassified Chelatococcus]CAH1657664.1 3-succinoylsemialdehyde-pyridine dehydrogenase [Hyphomicrobiales bacterium]MBS7742279.1 aldehyde dehydrogenase family protein [Chelatococcus sp. HY11]MBX3542603.1 aldehyde dehydrogenase family protein [Chelatococcus sp.]MCO5075180.1 aldehyde dehydrogenase family protein [Chelatococcus sp.]CAH1689261.1 3-succinoylsemialdehyde-pyridine dehydrogenase [Hyphomicrobiales bacterium]
MERARFHYINGQWCEPTGAEWIDVRNPASESVVARVPAGTAADVDRAVAAARGAFAGFSTTSVADRLAMLRRIIEVYRTRQDEIAAVLSEEMGTPITLARSLQAPRGGDHFAATADALEAFAFEERIANGLVIHEAIGVAALITPWNWPLNQIAAKLAPALAAGCTVVFKPSEIAPLNAVILAEVLHEAGVPAGVFNLVHGDGPGVGRTMAQHPDIDMISFTGSTRAGVSVAIDAAPSVKRVAQELGGKSANILMADADFEAVVPRGFTSMCTNAGQSCNAPSRMLVPVDRYEDVVALIRRTAAEIPIGQPADPATVLGPVANANQFTRVQGFIEQAMAEGAELICGGPGRPPGFNAGYFVRPTAFGRVTAAMTIAKEEVFGPVLSVQTYKTIDEAIAIANDSPYGLAAYVQGRDQEAVRAVARRLRVGMVSANYPRQNLQAPFGGYKQSGNGREYGKFGLAEFLETKVILMD